MELIIFRTDISVLNVLFKLSKDDFLGGFMVDLHEVPLRRPPEAPLSPQWYKLEAKTGKGSARGI